MANPREHQDDPTTGSNDPATDAPRPTPEVHRLRTLDSGAEVLGIHFTRQIAPIKPQGGQSGILHRG